MPGKEISGFVNGNYNKILNLSSPYIDIPVSVYLVNVMNPSLSLIVIENEYLQNGINQFPLQNNDIPHGINQLIIQQGSSRKILKFYHH